MKSKISKLQIIRIVIQIICFILLPGLFIDSFSGIKVAIESVTSQSPTLITVLSNILPTVLLVTVTAILGRFFCGWMCAFGTLGDVFYFIGNKLFNINFKVNETVDNRLKIIKYIILLFVITTVCFLGISLFMQFSPWDAFGMLNSFPPDFKYALENIPIGTLILFVILVASMFIERFFCRYLCPMGAVFSVVSIFKIGKIKKTRDVCGKCKLCTKNCAMGIDLYKMDVVNSGECIQCMQCVSPCPRKNATFTISNKDLTPSIVSIAVLLVIGLYYIGNQTINNYQQYAHNYENQSENILPDENNIEGVSPSVDEGYDESPIVNNESEKYNDGTYQGSGTGFKGRTTTVSVNILNGKIDSIQTVSTGDDGPYYNRAFSSANEQIISTQDTLIDTVSGATYSSNGIISAVEDALSKAKR